MHLINELTKKIGNCNNHFSNLAKFLWLFSFPDNSIMSFFSIQNLLAWSNLHCKNFLFDHVLDPIEIKTIFQNIMIPNNPKLTIEILIFIGSNHSHFFSFQHSTHTGDTPYQVWFKLNKTLTDWKLMYFKKKIEINENLRLKY